RTNISTGTQTNRWWAKAHIRACLIASITLIAVLVQILAGRNRQGEPLANAPSRATLAVADVEGADAIGDVLSARPRPPAPAAAPLAVGETVQTGSGQRRRLALADETVLYVNVNSRVTLSAERRLSLDTGEIFLEVAGVSGSPPFVVHT